MLHLPPQSHKARELFSVADLAATGGKPSAFPTFRDARFAVRDTFAADAAVRGINVVCLRATGELWLVEFRRSGAWRKVWNFGDPIAR